MAEASVAGEASAEGNSSVAIPPNPELEIEFEVVGYWADGSASLDITARLTNWDELAVGGPVPMAAHCSKAGKPVGACDVSISFSPVSDPAGVQETFNIRVPAGHVLLILDHGGATSAEFQLDVPRRIVGFPRNVWECFSDTSTADTVFEELNGIGCAGWQTATIEKREKFLPVGVFVDGPEGFTREFRRVLGYLSQILDLQFEQVASSSDAEIVAYIGAENSTTPSGGAICFGEEDFGCAERVWVDGEVKDRIVVFNHWPEMGHDYGDFDDSRRIQFRSSMIYALVHTLTGMGHRADEFSLMHESVHHRTFLDPMDEALLRLHGHELVESGMSFEDVRQLLVLDEELLGQPQQENDLISWSLLRDALEMLREETTVRYQVRASSPGCTKEFGWSEYAVGNLTDRHPYMSWVSLDDGDSQVYALQPDAGVYEFWLRTGLGWFEISPEEYFKTFSGWQGELSDPHFLLTAMLHNADWNAASISTYAEGQVEIGLQVNSIAAPFSMGGAKLEATLLVTPSQSLVVEYVVNWHLKDHTCESYLVEAREGELGVDIVFPTEVQWLSWFLDTCQPEPRSFLSENLTGFHRTAHVWARECGPGTSGEGYARKVSFSLGEWAFVRFEVFSHDDIRMELYRMDSSGPELVNPEASGYLIGGYGLQEQDGRLRWAHVPLAPGEYFVEAISLNRETVGGFTLQMFAQHAPPPPYRFKAVTAGINLSCGILLEGIPICWGGNLGHGSVPPAGEFISISAGGFICAIHQGGNPECWDGFRNAWSLPEGEKLEAMSVGWVHACGVRFDGTPVCWGVDQGGKASPPIEEKFIQVSSGTSHSCGLRADGAAICWGQDRDAPWEVPGGPFVSVSVGDEYDCALRRDGEIVCQGDEGLTICETRAGGWGACTIPAWYEGVPQSPPDGERFSSLSSSKPNCALRPDGSPVCWSERLRGPFPEPEEEQLITVSATNSHACGLRRDGTAICWGYNRFGQASPPSGVYAEVRDQRAPPAGLTAISGGVSHTCALDSEKQVVCWGPNWWRGRFTGSFVAVSSGGAHACAINTDGTVHCRGADSHGQSSPLAGAFSAISAGGAHTCGLRSDGIAECWGDSSNERTTPPPGELFRSISSGLAHVCGLRSDGTAACWGGSWDRHDLKQAALPPGGEFIEISSGAFHTCGLRPGGEAVCWGLNRDGQSSPPPGNFISISSGRAHSCGLREDGTAACWGAGSANNTESYNHGQGMPPEGEKFASISAGSDHTCGLRTDGTVLCWGDNDFGQAMPKR